MHINFNHLKTFYNALVHKMKNSRGNWEQNDPTADDYIKNRTHYSEGIQEVIVLHYEIDTDVSTATPMVSAGPEIYRIFFDATDLQSFVVGQQYSVKWNNASYTCVAKMVEGLPVLGDVGLTEGYEESGEPFLIALNPKENFGIIMTTQAGKYPITVTTRQEVIHKLDKKFIDLPDFSGLPDLPDNIVTTDNLVDNLPDNIITADELADVATTGDYADLENTPTDLTVYNNLRLQPSNDIFGQSFILLGSASCKDSNEAMIAAYVKNGTSFGTMNTTDGVHWSYQSFNPSSGVPYNVTPEDMDSGKLLYSGSGHKDTSILISDKYVGYHTSEKRGWDIQNFPITLTNGSAWNTVCFGEYKAIALSGPSKTSSSSNAIPSSVAAVCNAFDDTTSTYTWSKTTMPEEALWSNAAFGKLNGTNTFIAISYGTIAAYSTDGRTWTATQMPINASWRWIACGKYNCVAVSLEGDAAYTSDGIQWKIIPSDLKPFAGPISVSNGRFVSLSADEGAIHSRYSDTGVLWEESTYILPKSFKGCSIIQTTPNLRLMAFDSSSNYIMSDSEGVAWTSGVLTINNKLENKNIANALVPYVMDTVAAYIDNYIDEALGGDY